MKANELMIGDWLNTSRGIAKVIAVDKIGLTFKIDGGDFDIDRDDEEEWFDAIPLTPEILEKNGFVFKKGFMQKGNFGDGPLILWHTEDNKILRHFTHELELSDLSSDKGFRIRFECNFVHQLQHALRLCGIEKEIMI